MARQNEAKVKFSADTKQFNDEIKSANAAMSGLRGELKLNQAQMKNAGESVDGLTKSKKLLEQQELALQQKVTALSSKLEASNRAFGEGSAESQKLTNQLNAARTAQERVKGQIEQTSQAIERQKAAESQAESAYSQLSSKISEQRSRLAQLEREYADAALAKGKDSAEAKQLGSAIQELSRELRQNEGRMQDAEGAARDFASSLDEVEKESADAKNSIGELAVGTMVADFAKQGIDSVLGLCDATEEFQAHMTQLETTFQNSGRTVDEANRTYKLFLGLCGDSDQAIEAAQDMNNLADAGADIDRWYDIAAGTVSAFGDALPVENLIESANETIRTGQVTGGLADALNWTSINLDDLNAKLGEDHPEAMAAFSAAIDEGQSTEDALNTAFEQCSDSAERQQILTELLSGQYTDLGKSFEDANRDIIESRNVSAALESAQADLAAKVRPLQTDIKLLAAEGIAFLTDNIGWLLPVVGSAAVAFGVLAVAMNLDSICARLSSGISGIGSAFTALAANPAMVAIAAIALVVGALVGLYNTSDSFKAWWDAIWGQISGIAGETFAVINEQLLTPLAQGFGQMVSDLGSVVGPAIQQFGEVAGPILVQAFSDFCYWLVNVALPALLQFGQWFGENIIPILQAFWDFVSANILTILAQLADFVLNSVVPALAQLFAWVGDNIVPVLAQLWSWFAENIVPILAQLAEFILSSVVPALAQMWQWFSENIIPVLQALWDFFSANILPILAQLASFVLGKVVPALQRLWEFFSANILPVLQQVWDAVGTGIGKFSEFAGKVEGFISDAKSTVKGGLDSIKGFFDGLNIGFPHIPLPHFTVSGSFNLDPFNFSLPSIGVEVYAKGAVLKRPTVFGMNGGNAMIGGEAGPEAVAPIAVLQGYVTSAVSSALGSGIERIVSAVERLGDRVTVLEVDGREFARATAGPRDRVDGSRQSFTDRGLATT